MSKPKIDLKYIRKVLQFIENGPKLRFQMFTWGSHRSPKMYSAKELKELNYPSCGTRACFAGWGVLLKHRSNKWGEIANNNSFDMERRARKLYGFTAGEADQVFCGIAVKESGFENQFATLKHVINRVLEARGMKERV